MKIILPAKLPSFLYYRIHVPPRNCKGSWGNNRLVGAFPLSWHPAHFCVFSRLNDSMAGGRGFIFNDLLNFLNLRTGYMRPLLWWGSCSQNSPLLPSRQRLKARQILFCAILTLQGQCREVISFGWSCILIPNTSLQFSQENLIWSYIPCFHF